VDFTVCHPLAPSKWPLQLPVVADALKKAEKKKVLVAQERCTHAGWSYVAAAFSPWGMPGPSAAGLLQEITRRATASLEGWERSKHSVEINQGFSITVARQLARQLSLRYRVIEEAHDSSC
jgi:hypothetical protein